MSAQPTHIGVAAFTLNGYPIQWVIVLSSCPYFYSNTKWCGTVIESVNGWKVSWKTCENSPTSFAPYTTLMGIINVGTVNQQPNDIIRSTSTIAWNPQHSGGGKKYPPTDEYVRQVIFHLCNNRTIALPSRVKVVFSTHIEERLAKMQEMPPPRIDMFPIIPIGEGDVVFVGRNAVERRLELIRVITN